MIHTLDHLLHVYGYSVITILVAIECAGAIVPGETIFLAGCIYASTTGRLNIAGVIAAAAVGATIGNIAGYWLGRYIGHALLTRHGRRIGLTPERLLIGRYLFARHGGKVVFLGRFATVLRSFTPLLAGANAMPWRPFLAWTIAGGIAWPLVHGIAVYALGNAARHLRGPAGVALAAVGIATLAAMFLFAKRNETRLQETALRWHAHEPV